MAARHDEYYFNDGDAIFQVGDQLFRVHKRLFDGGEWSTFDTMFSLPQSRNAEGQTDGNPIILDGDKLEEFEALMRILYPPLLDEPMDIPTTTYIQAMHIADKYSIDNVQIAIMRVVNSWLSKSGTGPAIARLAFVAEFHHYFPEGDIRQAFVQACQSYPRPSGHDLRPLMAQPGLVALMMQYREEKIKPDEAIWNKKCERRYRVGSGYEYLYESAITLEEEWLNEQLQFLGFM